MDHEAVDAQDREAIHAALDAVLDAGPANTGEALGAALSAASSVRCAIDGALVRVLPAFEASMAWAGDGHRSPVAWMVAHLGTARAAAASERRVALAAARMDHVAAAAAAGRLNASRLRLLVDARRAPVEETFDRDEPLLVAEAMELSVDALKIRLLRWYYDALAELGRNDPDDDPGGTDRNAIRLQAGFGGRGLLDGDLSAEGRATLESAIAAEIERWRREGTLEADPRTWNELQGDALVQLAARGAARPEHEPARPLVIALADLDTLLRRSGLTAGERTLRRAEISGGGPVSDATIAELASRAGVALLVTGPSGQPLWFGRARRLASPSQRTAVLAADGGCCHWPGCGAPAHRCQVDHLTGWEQGGTTDIDNLARSAATTIGSSTGAATKRHGHPTARSRSAGLTVGRSSQPTDRRPSRRLVVSRRGWRRSRCCRCRCRR